MRHRILALLLAGAMVLTLAACGGGDSAGDPSTSPSESQTPEASPSEPSEKPSPSESPSEKPSEEPSESPSEEPSEEPSESPSEEPSEEPSESPSEEPSEEPSESPSEEPSEEPPASSTPPAPTGSGNLVEQGVLPTPKPTSSPEPNDTPAPSQGTSVDLQKFYESLLVTDPESEDFFAPEAPVEGDALAAFFPGLEDIAAKQRVIYQPMISAVACEIALVEVENAADVQKVKDIFQARINTQVGTDDEIGGAWYPETIEGWKNNSRIVSNGNYVMLIVWEKADQFVEQFNALF